MNAPIILLIEGTESEQGKAHIINNINACQLVANTVRTTCGPHGMDKLIIDGKGAVTITNDGATILKKLDVSHPVAKTIIDIAKSQDAEIGDGTTSVVVLAPELLKEPKPFIEEGVHPHVDIHSFRNALNLVMKRLDALAVKLGDQSDEAFMKCASTTSSSNMIAQRKDISAKLVKNETHNETHNTFLVIFKVHGETINLWSHETTQMIGDTHFFRISCHNVETHPDHPGSDIQVFTLTEPAPIVDSCNFRNQHLLGEPIASEDMILFMTGPVASSRKASYAIDIGISKREKFGEDFNEENYDKIGAAYLYLDPSFSSQGVQRTPIIATQKHLPIGQIQVEYLIVTNPVAYGLDCPRPDWLFSKTKLDAGHRGSGSGRRLDLPDELLENTIASFNYAHRHGADMCELDVLLSADGEPVVYHDFDVDAVAAQQSSDELGKLRVQVNEFTMKQLREFRLLALHDDQGSPYTLNVPKQHENNKPFPTLAQVLNEVDESCGLNIEIKWPQLLESGKMEARRCREINDFVDKIIDVVSKNARKRRIVLESFDADLVIMLRLKQNNFPVIFLSQGMTEKYERYVDVRARSVRNGVYFAQAFDLAGIDLILDYYVMSGKKLVDFINKHGLVARAWGELGEGTLSFLKEIDIQCITYDKIDLIKQAEQAQEEEKHHQEQQIMAQSLIQHSALVA